MESGVCNIMILARPMCKDGKKKGKRELILHKVVGFEDCIQIASVDGNRHLGGVTCAIASLVYKFQV